MQFAGYDAASDLLLNPNALAVQGGHFYTDPSYPAVPSSIQFTDPILNLGPDANLYRDPLDGIIKDASLTGEPIAFFHKPTVLRSDWCLTPMNPLLIHTKEMPLF